VNWLKKRKRMIAELKKLVAEQPGDQTFLEFAIEDPDGARRIMYLAIALGVEYNEADARAMGLEPQIVRDEVWGKTAGS